MRSAPIAFATKTSDEAFILARDAAVLTHGHPTGYLAAAYFTSLVFDLARDVSLEDAMRQADALLAREEDTKRPRARSMSREPRRLRRPRRYRSAPERRMGRGVGARHRDHVRARRATSVADALWRAAAHGGDSDSTASLAGNLLGAMGAPLPRAWLDELEMRDVIERTAKELGGP